MLSKTRLNLPIPVGGIVPAPRFPVLVSVANRVQMLMEGAHEVEVAVPRTTVDPFAFVGKLVRSDAGLITSGKSA